MKMKTRKESDVESDTKEEENRKEAGIELAAEPTEVILFFPTIYFVLGISAIIFIVSIICWIGTTLIWWYFVWSVLSTLSITLIIFLPDYFSNIISFAINLCFWIAFCIFAFYYVIYIAAYKDYICAAYIIIFAANNHNPTGKQLLEANEFVSRVISYWQGCTITIFILSLLVILLMGRMTLYYYRNR